MMDKRSWYEQQKAASKSEREWLPQIKMGKDGKFFIKDEDGEWDGKVLGEKFSAVPVIAVFQRRLWEGGYPNGELVCGADKEGGFRGMKPHFENPKAPVCGRCPHRRAVGGNCAPQFRIVVGRIGKDKRDNLFVVCGSSLAVGEWANLEKALKDSEVPVMGHRLAFGGGGARQVAVSHRRRQDDEGVHG